MRCIGAFLCELHMIKTIKIFTRVGLLVALAGCGGSGDEPQTTVTPEPEKVYPEYTNVLLLGGDTTAIETANSGHGFSTPATNLSDSNLAIHLAGDAHFETSFTTAPNLDHPEFDGLGPVFNNANCNSCHQRDGRNSTIVPLVAGERVKLGSDAGIFLRMSLPHDQPCIEPSADNNYCHPIAVPDFGTQLFHRGVLKARPDWQQNQFGGQADVYISYQYSTVTYPDGTEITLKKPMFDIENPYDAPNETKHCANITSNLLQSDVLVGARNSMPVFGLGLLEAISEADILANVDIDDVDNDGISGRANYVFDQLKANDGEQYPVSLGRFGWKANAPTVVAQGLEALRSDMGITNPMFTEESVVGTSLHDSYLARTGFIDTGVGVDGEPETNQQFADEVIFYVETLAVPARRNISDSDTREGARFFEQVNCSGCHIPKFVTQASGNIGGKPIINELAAQTIYPFSDLLLHDMGPDLADGRPDFLASGSEWRTRPLWGIGLTQTVNPQAGFLHDGRAASVEEAILWHGGEAEASRNQFMALSAIERKQLLKFVMSL